jgi:glucose-1-phosphate thymidylyltransferase
MYDSRVFDIVKTLKKSDRGELEITDVNNDYIKHGTMTYDILDGWWIDAGSSPDNLSLAAQLVIRDRANKAT